MSLGKNANRSSQNWMGKRKKWKGEDRVSKTQWTITEGIITEGKKQDVWSNHD